MLNTFDVIPKASTPGKWRLIVDSTPLMLTMMVFADSNIVYWGCSLELNHQLDLSGHSNCHKNASWLVCISNCPTHNESLLVGAKTLSWCSVICSQGTYVYSPPWAPILEKNDQLVIYPKGTSLPYPIECKIPLRFSKVVNLCGQWEGHHIQFHKDKM